MRLSYIFLTASSATTFFVTCSTFFLIVKANNDGFTVDLIHRDSPKSPLYNPLLTHSERVKNAFQRSLNRASQFASTTSITPNGGEYLMKISYGTPPIETLAIVDIGSDLTWTMCLPCTTCVRNNSSLFDPKNSSTFEHIPCTSKPCHEFSYSFCSLTNTTTCEYEVIYGDLSSISGDLATETITLEGSSLGVKMSFPNFIFGCGHGKEGDFTEEGSGIVGLGIKKESLISQLNSSFHGKFSYCFGPSNDVSKPGKIRFGDNPIFLQGGVVSTPLFLGDSYYLKLAVYSDIPNVSIHFRGADLKLNPENIFQRTSTSSVYLGFVPSDSSAMFGNLAQANFWVEYDLENQIVSFHRANCTS
ncbi:hypothetical protein ACH5RR_023571 [Cinchona calisaya]|uniref:Peptidase A1 domain-containing protein n=1 Tax=Cinchona calisaya TaxID=153742 RepID=A0ABD2ZCJ8_9GENT